MDGAIFALHAGLDTVLRLQDGIIRRDQAMAAGLPESTVSSRVRRRSWIRVLPGVYAVDVDPHTPTARVRATALWAGDDSTVSGSAAAWWWGLTDHTPEEIEVLVPPARRMSTFKGITVIRARVAEREVELRRRLRVTTKAATCLHLARHGEPDLLDVALRTGTRQADLDEALQLGRGRRGQLQARQSREEVRDNPWSSPERDLHRRLRDAGITGWKANPAIFLGAGERRHPDVLFEDVPLILELDRRRHHSSPSDHDSDHARQNSFIDLGYTVLRFTPRQIALEPEMVIALVRRAVARLTSAESTKDTQTRPS